MILLLLGRSGCGKSTIEHLLIMYHGYEKVRTCTTRDRREGESEDAYHFMSQYEFVEHIENGDFAEWDKYGDHFYGTLKESLISDDKLVCAIMPEGAANIKKVMPDAFVVNVETDMKTSVLRAIGREKELDPGRMRRIYTRAAQDYYRYEDLACDYVAENTEGTDLTSLADTIAEKHLRYASGRLLPKEIADELKESVENPDEDQPAGMSHGRCMELLNQIINHVSTANNTSGTVRELLYMGFEPEELTAFFSFSQDDVDDVADEMESEE